MTFIGSFEGVQKYYVAYESSSSSVCATIKKRYEKNDTLTFIYQDYIKTFDIILYVKEIIVKIKCFEIKP